MLFLIMPVSVVVAVMVITVVVAFADSQSAVTQSGGAVQPCHHSRVVQ